jgi:hypothetical protein
MPGSRTTAGARGCCRADSTTRLTTLLLTAVRR